MLLPLSVSPPLPPPSPDCDLRTAPLRHPGLLLISSNNAPADSPISPIAHKTKIAPLRQRLSHEEFSPPAVLSTRGDTALSNMLWWYHSIPVRSGLARLVVDIRSLRWPPQDAPQPAPTLRPDTQ